jgi:hypothetical protein
LETNDSQSPNIAEDGRDDCCGSLSGWDFTSFAARAGKSDVSEDFHADPYPDEGDGGEDDPDEDDRPDGGRGVL